MAIDVRPATRFMDIATILAPRNPESAACWCLSYRLSPKENRELEAHDRPRVVEQLCRRDPAPGVLAYLDGEVAGWAGVAPRSDLHQFSHSTKFPHVDDQPVWSLWCFKVRPGFRKQGLTQALIRGAIDFARDHGAPAVEGYPVDNGDRRVDATMAYVGTRAMFERAGFAKVADTDAVSNGIPRVLMRLALE